MMFEFDAVQSALFDIFHLPNQPLQSVNTDERTNGGSSVSTPHESRDLDDSFAKLNLDHFHANSTSNRNNFHANLDSRPLPSPIYLDPTCPLEAAKLRSFIANAKPTNTKDSDKRSPSTRSQQHPKIIGSGLHRLPLSQHLRIQLSFAELCEWLNFDFDDDSPPSTSACRALLRSPQIRPYFLEYKRCLASQARKGETPERITCEELRDWILCTEAFEDKNYYLGDDDNSDEDGEGEGEGEEGREEREKYRQEHWEPIHHAAKFVVRVLKASWQRSEKGKEEAEWDCGKFDPLGNDDSEMEFFQVWCVLMYLQGEWEAAWLPKFGIRLGDVEEGEGGGGGGGAWFLERRY